MAMAALSCLTPLAGRRSSTCISLFRATLHSSSHVKFSVATSVERGLRSHGVRDEEKGFSLRTERQRSITVKAASQGAIDSPLMKTMATKIKDSLKAEDVSIVDAYGDGRHVSIDVTAEAFEGQSRVNRQRMVYKAIWEELQSAVHAVDQLRTRTPAEAEKAGKSL